MFFLGTTKDQNVVQEDKHELIKAFPQQMIHYSLKGSWCIAQPKRHDCVLIGPITRHEGSLMYISFFYPDLMISGSQINFGEIRRPMQSVHEFFHLWERIPIFCGDFI